MTVQEITLGFRAFDVHELLLHFIAERLGYYREAGLKVRLRDLTFVTDYREHSLSVACGSALVARAKGIMQKVVFLGTDYPMFWVYGDITAKQADNAKQSVADGTKLVIATFPPLSPPWYLLPAVLRGQGIHPENVELMPVRDDIGRLGLLRSRNVGAAVISSAFPPAKLEAFGLAPRIFFGHHVRIPTTGLTASEELIQAQPEVVQKIVRALSRSLQAVRESKEQIVKIIADVLGDSAEIARTTYELIAPCFSTDGRGDDDSRRKAVKFANEEFGQGLSEKDVYDFRFL